MEYMPDITSCQFKVVFMKVLFVCEGFDSISVVAQPWRHIYEIAKRMKSLGHEVEILTDLVHGLPRDESVKGVSVKRIRKGLFFFDFNELTDALNEADVDIVNWRFINFSEVPEGPWNITITASQIYWE